MGYQTEQVAGDVFRIATRWVNLYAIREGQDWILVDAGYPGYRRWLAEALREIGLRLADLSGIVLTHHHVDHAGMGEWLRREGRARVFVHDGDRERIEGRRASHPPRGFYRHSWRPSMARYLAHTVAYGGARYAPVEETVAISQDEELDLPGGPRVIPTPGHTAGHCSVVLGVAGVLLAGDAMVNFDYARGKTGLNLHRFNEDRAGAFESLTRLEVIDADFVGFGHGEPWRQGAGRAVELVRARIGPDGTLA